MFKKRIAFKLTAGFISIVLVSMLALGIIFVQVFRQYAFDSRQETMLVKARSIAQVVSENMPSNGQMRGFGGFARFLDTMAEAKVWVMDRQGNPLILTGMGQGTVGDAAGKGAGLGFDMSPGMGAGMGTRSGAGQEHSFYSGPLPPEAEKVIQDVLSGKESISRSFSDVYHEATLTVGIPITDSNKNVIGSVLMHMPVTGITDALDKTISILLISLFVALIVAIGLGVFYSFIFTRPLKIMNNVALEMARGNYTARTGINRQDELGHLGNSLDFLSSELGIAIEKVNQLEQVRRDFVANVSHEFRTPLTVIRGSLEALTDGTIQSREDIERYQKRMLSETRSLERLVSDLLELSRLQSGKISIILEPVYIANLLCDVVKNLQSIADKKSITLVCNVPDDLPPISGDYDRLRQLFVIFLDNAIKYSPDKTTVIIQADRTNTLNIMIQDQGYGIPEEELPYIWDRFYKTDKSRTSKGTGLGLAIARHLVELLKGQVVIESILGKGTTVMIRFPLIL
ncbi:MAG: HAMP domain-containing protein [Peptococcaceae bacterium]|nr:HAMP domain-containing protein [Peptococcaceae bacterium]